ncbi:MAG: hypothetical protein JNM93_08700 [Bacteriovoracaceae bacterium]|nr:hypothetical protein [Bacteriovoracaceae bacterium]
MKLLILFFVSFSTLFAQEREFEIFKKNWENPDIQSSYCGNNSQLFIKWLDESKIDLSNTQLWQITNKGFDYFGLVKYYQNRWGGSVPSPLDPTYITNGSGGWHYHAFVVHNGMVYDYSYKKEPTVVPLKDYLTDMFTLRHDVGDMFWENKAESIAMTKKYEVVGLNAYDILKASKEKLKLSDFEFHMGFVFEHIFEQKSLMNKIATKLNILPVSRLKFSRSLSCDYYFNRPNPMVIPKL